MIESITRECDVVSMHDSDVEVTLVARENFFLFTPMLHEVATSEIDADNIVSPIRFLLKRTSFIEGLRNLEVTRRDMQHLP